MSARPVELACAVLVLLAWALSARRGLGAPPAVAGLGDELLTLAAERPLLDLGAETHTTLTIRLAAELEASGALPGRARATVGSVGPIMPTPGHPGTFSAVYWPPPELRPQAVVIVVEMVLADGRRLHAATHVRLQAPTRFPLRTSPSARVTITIGGRTFGPVVADESGEVFVPIVVPPGVATGTARAVNRFGVAKETAVDLQSLDYPRILLLADADGEVGTDCLAEVWAIDPTGAAASPDDLDLGVSTGTVRRVAGAPGVARFAVTLPRTVGSGRLSLIASMNDGSSTDVATLSLRPGPPAEMGIHADRASLAVGSQRHAAVLVTVRDRFGNAVEPRGLVTLVDGAPVPAQIAPDLAMFYIRAPATWRNQDRLVARADLGSLHAAAAIAITGGAPASARLAADRTTLEGTGTDSTAIRLRILDASGIPAGAARVSWSAQGRGVLTELPSSAPGDYRARFSPGRTLRDADAVVIATVDDRLSSAVPVHVQGVPARSVTARAGLVTNLSSTIGPSLFVDAIWPLPLVRPRSPANALLTRRLGLGFAFGYTHTDVTTGSTASSDGVRLELDQLPVLGVARVRLPLRSPAEVFVSGIAGMTFANLSIAASEGLGPVITRATAHGFTVGLGAEASVPLEPGQLVLGARYLRAELGRTSAQDRLRGNSLGWICDLGFKLGF